MTDTNQSSSSQILLRLHHASEIRADTTLANILTTFVNKGYRYFTPETALRWNRSAMGGERLKDSAAIHDTIGHDGMFAVAYDARDGTTPLACAAARQWTHDLEGVSAAGEKGWEVVTVTTRADWMRRGLAGQCIDALVEELIRRAREDGSDERLQVWVHVVECLNGAYWRKKGWAEVRTYEKPAGHWGSKFGYRLLVLRRDFEVN
jgi:GNAT superfamily N-acetyltransferase